MWEGPDIGFFDGFEVTVSPPDGVVRLPILLKGNGELKKSTSYMNP